MSLPLCQILSVFWIAMQTPSEVICVRSVTRLNLSSGDSGERGANQPALQNIIADASRQQPGTIVWGRATWGAATRGDRRLARPVCAGTVCVGAAATGCPRSDAPQRPRKSDREGHDPQSCRRRSQRENRLPLRAASTHAGQAAPTGDLTELSRRRSALHRQSSASVRPLTSISACSALQQTTLKLPS